MEYYCNMTLREMDSLDRSCTVFFMSVSPLEAHGPHLPLGTDVMVSEELIARYSKALEKEYPHLTQIKLPPLCLGADVLPVKGSLQISASQLKKILADLGKGLARQGFRYLFLADNHGGPRHQLAIEAAAKQLWKKHRFYLINPFLHDYKLMVNQDHNLVTYTGLKPGQIGDDTDAHAGANETSLMLATFPDFVDEDYHKVAPSTPPPPSFLLKLVSRIAGFISCSLQHDLTHLACLTTWIKQKDMKAYLGKPGMASPEAGEAMLRFRVEEAMKFFRRALRGEPVQTPPMLWYLHFILWFSR